MKYKCNCCGKEINEGGLIFEQDLESWAVCSSCIVKSFHNIMEEQKELADFMTEFERLHEENKDKYDYE